MGKANSTFVRPLWMASLFALALFMAPSAMNAQVGCHDEIIVTLADTSDCNFVFTAEHATAGTPIDGSLVIVEGGSGNVINSVGLFNYVLYMPADSTASGEDSTICWGTVRAEDKTAPHITAPENDTLECWLVDDVLNNASTLDPSADEFLGLPSMDDCSDLEAYTWADAVEYGTCDDDFYARITRRFAVSDIYGNSATDIQVIVFETVDADEFAFSAADGFELTAAGWVYTEQTCDPDSDDRPGYVYPTYDDSFGNTVSLDDAGCNLSVNNDHVLFDNVCADGSFKEERSIKVFDWCEGGVTEEFTYTVKVGDFEAPEFDDCAMDNDEFNDLTGANLSDYSLSRPDDIVDDLNGVGADRDDIADTGDVCIKTVSTGPMDCTAAINTSLASLRAMFGDDIVTDCADPSITVEVISYVDETIGKIPTGNKVWEIGGYTRQGQMVVGLPVGFHALVINATDGCYNSSTGIVFFDVEDLTKPVMKCDDDLRVTLVDGDAKLGITGYALATAADVDEGSWDNCELESLHVRRYVDNASGAADDYEAKYGSDYRETYIEATDYSAWADIVEFFCADIGVPVEVQLRGTDSNDNTSICWLNIDVENGLNYSVTLDGGGSIDCQDDPITQENVYDYITVTQTGTQCNGPAIGVTITEELDQCGVGRYVIALDVTGGDESKNNAYVDPDPVYVNVTAVHDYWVKFPADETYDCGEDTDIAGVDVSEDVACDLLAISTLPDEVFAATSDPDACYKIFRTYRVINWCEYDGEALPVIVSRDWDAHNGCDSGPDQNADNDLVDAGEYNLNPAKPDGDGAPGDEDIYVIVDVDANGGIVYYDNNADPYDSSTADLSGDNTPTADFEGYWWAVTTDDRCNPSRWEDSNPADVSQGSPAQDDDDNRYGSHGFWQYTQHIVVYDDTDPVAVIDAQDWGSENNFDCAAPTSFTVSITDACSIEDITTTVYVNDQNEDANATTTVNGDTVVVTVADRRAIGNYKIKVEVNDGCGNITTVEDEFDVFDDKAPGLLCQEGIVVELMPQEGGGGAMAVWASDFIQSPVGDCSGQSDAEVSVGNGVTQPMITEDAYSIYFEDSIAADADWVYTSPFADGNEGARGIMLTCDHLNGADENTVMVRVYNEDGVGNEDFCITFVRVQDNMNACGDDAGDGSIAGAVQTETGENVPGVEVSLSGAQSRIQMTQEDGAFHFRGLAAGGDYTVSALRDDAAGNGVSTFDLILITKHIIGVDLLDSPYKLVAADVNNSGSISTLDLIQLRKLILNIDTEFSNNTSWRFAVGQMPANPLEGFAEVMNINNLSNEQLSAGFVAIKIGDVNGSALVEAREATGTLAINAAETAMIAGNEYTVEFSADMKDIAGYQFTLDVKGAEIVDLIEGAATAENFGIFAKEGVITTSFDGDAAGNLFSLVIRATEDANLSEVLSINSRYTAAEAYTNDADQLNVALNFTGAEAQVASFELSQNTPNPFVGETVIGFNLPEAGEATLTLQDVAGKTIKVIEGDFAKGYNQVTLKASDLPSTGVFFYTLTLGDLTATKKMITVE